MGGNRSLAEQGVLRRRRLDAVGWPVLVRLLGGGDLIRDASELKGFLSDDEVKTLALDGLVGVLLGEEPLPVCSMLCRTKVVDDSSTGAVSPGIVGRAAWLIFPGTVQRLGKGSPDLRRDFAVCPV